MVQPQRRAGADEAWQVLLLFHVWCRQIGDLCLACLQLLNTLVKTVVCKAFPQRSRSTLKQSTPTRRREVHCLPPQSNREKPMSCTAPQAIDTRSISGEGLCQGMQLRQTTRKVSMRVPPAHLVFLLLGLSSSFFSSSFGSSAAPFEPPASATVSTTNAEGSARNALT